MLWNVQKGKSRSIPLLETLDGTQWSTYKTVVKENLKEPYMEWLLLTAYGDPVCKAPRPNSTSP